MGFNENLLKFTLVIGNLLMTSNTNVRKNHAKFNLVRSNSKKSIKKRKLNSRVLLNSVHSSDIELNFRK